MFYVYCDVNLDTSTPFYFGSGNLQRVQGKNRRNKKWINYTNKHTNWKRVVLHTTTCREDAYDIEEIYIALSWDDKSLCNLVVDSRNHSEASKLAIEIVQSQEYKERHSESSKKMWEDRAYREKTTEAIRVAYQNPDVREERSKSLQNLWQQEDYRSKMLEKRKEQSQRESYKKKQSDIQKIIKNTPEAKKAASERSKKLYEQGKIKPPLTGTSVKCVELDLEFESFVSATSYIREHYFHIGRDAISECIRGKRKTAANFTWIKL